MPNSGLLPNGYFNNIDREVITQTVLWIQPWYLYQRWQLRTYCAYDVKQVIAEKKIGFDDSFYVTKCLKQIRIPRFTPYVRIVK